uniref:Uncharacterized protein n=1 Tax=Zooxanthella nutricula TaxID=1333877 RepID=A0A6U6IJF1_9DINO|mmetsp:Transcript_18954/g.56658  ORF Transcript_18954/g.56658 Transcript_18954/m.56658 type:complete len:209 (+) Transcript_18954:115-741(+)
MSPADAQNSLRDLVEHFAPGGCYGIEWEVIGDVLKQRAHYSPQWWVDEIAAKGLDGLYTTGSSMYGFPIGQGLVGKTFAKQKALFVKDLQTLNEESVKDSQRYGDGTEFWRAQLAKDFDIHSAIFLPLPSGVLEIGSCAVMASMLILRGMPQLLSTPQYFVPFALESTAPVAAAPVVHEALDALATSPPPFLQNVVDEPGWFDEPAVV